MSFDVHFEVEGVVTPLEVRVASGGERLGAPARIELELVARAPVPTTDVLERPCLVRLAAGPRQRVIAGLVTSWTSVVTAQAGAARRYRAVVESSWALLRHRSGSRVFQHLRPEEVVPKVLEAAGLDPASVVVRTTEEHAPREYLVAWQETDLAFVTRLCEEEGIWFHDEVGDDGVKLVLADTSPSAPKILEAPIPVVDESGLRDPAAGGGPLAWGPRLTEQRRVGKVTLRDHDFERPTLTLEGVDEAGLDVERGTEVYAAPGRFRSEAEGKTRARRHLEALRSDARRLEIRSSAVELALGTRFDLAHGEDYPGQPAVDGEWFVTALAIDYVHEERAAIVIDAVAGDATYRLPRVTPRPRIAGVQPAIVTGPPGAEIDADPSGRVHVRFFWDREGPDDDGSSLPIRCMQPNTPDSMVLPRIGWEVAVGFEDGDPDRPYVLGRVYNAKAPPPFALPANKTMTAIRSFSSPGGGRHNTITFDDAAGRQHVVIDAGFSKTTGVASTHTAQIAKKEVQGIHGSQTVIVGGNDALSVTESYLVQAASQSATVSGNQDVLVKGSDSVTTGSEDVLIGGALLEKVGNPVQGLVNLGVAAALAGAGAVGERLGRVGGAVMTVATTAAGIGWSMVQAANAPGAGPDAARDAGIRGLIGAAASRAPGGDAVFSAIGGGGRQLPWETPPAPSGGPEAGGGAGATASGGAGPAGPGPGHRNEQVKGGYVEAIGGAHVVVTPGNVKWQVAGASALVVGGAHVTRATKVDHKVLGASIEASSALVVRSKAVLGRVIDGSVAVKVAGVQRVKSGGEVGISAGSKVAIEAGGPLTCKGGVVAFVVDGTVVAASSSGVLIKAPKITINGATKQSGDTTH